jgi:hypothetical protein
MRDEKELKQEAEELLKNLGESSVKDTMEGFEDVDGSTKAVPFLRILQSLSPQVNPDDPDAVEGAKVGDLFNTVTKELYGREVRCIILKFEHLYIEWLPDRKGFVGYHSPENAERLAIDKSKFGKWKTAEGNLLQENYVYLILVEGYEREGMMVLSLSSTAIPEAKMLNRLMTSHYLPNGELAKPYYLVWVLKTELQRKDSYTWYSPRFVFDGYIGDSFLSLVKQERLALPAKKVDYAQIAAPVESDSQAGDF